MATTLGTLSPQNASFSGGAYYGEVNTRPVVRFIDGVTNIAYWSFAAPQGLASTLSLILHCMMATATSGKVDFAAAVEAVSAGDALDLDSATSFDADNTITAPSVPATAGYKFEIPITLTNADSIAPGDWVTVAVKRDGGDATNDTATGICDVLGVELRAA